MQKIVIKLTRQVKFNPLNKVAETRAKTEQAPASPESAAEGED